MNRDSSASLARRSFLSRMGVGATAFAAAFGAGHADAQQPPTPGAAAPARHAEDEWLEVPAAKHRLFMDTTSAMAFGRGLAWAGNFLVGSRNGYALGDADSAIVICARHEATPFGYTDAMWAKYGQELSVRAGNFLDPKTKAVPTVNVYFAPGYGEPLANNGATIDASAKRGIRFAVCALATRAAAMMIARRTGASVDDVVKELSDNLVPGARLVPAGVVAVNRSQERGYAFLYVS